MTRRMDDGMGQWLAGRYRLDRRLSTDTAGTVYEAWDGEHLLRVFVRILVPAVLDAPDAFDRYAREVAALRAIAHPGIIPARSIERDGGTVFLVLDIPPGASLRAVLRERDAPFTARESAHILGPVADALDMLHDSGIVHRNVRPDTITIRPDGTGALAEPLIAPVMRDADVLGLSPYLSPEQGSGQTAGNAADTYALGAMLYEMLTLAPPFSGEHAPPEVPEQRRVLWEQLHIVPVAPHARNALLPRRLDWTILSALHRDPTARPPSATDVVAALSTDARPPVRPTTTFPLSDEVTAAIGNLPPGGAGTTATVARIAGPAAYAPPYDAPHTGVVPEISGEYARAGRRRSVAVPALAVLTVLVLLSAAVLGTLVVRRNMTLTAQQDHYAAADAALGRGDYDTAIAEFGAAGAYRDAPARVQAAQTAKDAQANYDVGVDAFNREDFGAAADAFGKAGPFRDAPQRRVDALRLADQQQAYAEGEDALTREDSTTAATAFARAGTYRDAPQRATQAQTLIGQQRQYQTGQDAVAKEDYSTAAAAFRAAGAYKDAPQQATKAETLRGQKAAYDAGVAAAAREDYRAARQQFDAAGDYKDAKARATQADQERDLLARYNSAQAHLKASEWKDAYTDLQAIKRVRPDYRDVSAVIGHLENDVVNPTAVDVFALFNQRAGFKEAWVPVNNLIGQPVTWLYLQNRQPTATDNRAEQIGVVSVSLVAKQGSTTALNTDLPTLVTGGAPPDRATPRPGEKLFAVTDKGQTFEATEFGKYRVRLTITDLAPGQKAAGDTTTAPPLTRLTFDVTLTPKVG